MKNSLTGSKQQLRFIQELIRWINFQSTHPKAGGVVYGFTVSLNLAASLDLSHQMKADHELAEKKDYWSYQVMRSIDCSVFCVTIILWLNEIRYELYKSSATIAGMVILNAVIGLYNWWARGHSGLIVTDRQWGRGSRGSWTACRGAGEWSRPRSCL